ncbi:MAG: AAA family ATPase [Desulfamplus sp.]|nr:AAA family ATPase [Desulfamplus sp.]
MEKNPNSRYQSAVSLKNDLEICKKQWIASKIISSFELGAADHSDRFEIPNKLYGREHKIQILLESFERARTGKSELVLVSGYSGIGKSSIVHEIRKPILEKRGYFISGKFDQYQRNIPYQVFIQALRTLVQQIMTEPEPFILNWKEKSLKHWETMDN